MASSCAKRINTGERFVIVRDTDAWSSQLVRSVGVDKLLEVFVRTRLLQDVHLLKDFKTASVSHWSFDESCLFCCLRREKVQEHVVALNKQIVESGGKPLLGKDPSNVSRLEWQTEEFLNAVLHKKEYTPRIPDPHIPLVACGVLQQMIVWLASDYASRNPCSQVSSANESKKDPRLLRTPSSAAAESPSTNALTMEDQDAPLDLSVKKGKFGSLEQDGVLNLSTKKVPAPQSNHLLGPSTTADKRESVELSPSQVKDLQTASTLEQFMSKLCVHHQHQIVDALGFLQTEVKSASEPRVPSFSERQEPVSVGAAFEARSDKTCRSRTHEPSKKSEKVIGEVSIPLPVVSPNPVDLCRTSGLSSSSKLDAEHVRVPNKLCVTAKTNAEPQEARKTASLSDMSNVQPAEKKSIGTSCKTGKRTEPPRKVASKPPTSARPNVVSPSLRTARKSNGASFPKQSGGSAGFIINDPDSHCDLIYIRKAITECVPETSCRLHPRRNARKSTRGHKYVEEYLELKTVRTLARKSLVGDSTQHESLSGVPTALMPKQSLPKAGSASATGKLAHASVLPEPTAADEMTSVVGNFTGDALTVEISQTRKTVGNERASEIAIGPTEPPTQKDLPSNGDTGVQELCRDTVSVTETIEAPSETQGSISPDKLVQNKAECRADSKPACENKETGQKLGSENGSKDRSTDAISEESRNASSSTLLDVTIVPVDQTEASENNVPQMTESSANIVTDSEPPDVSSEQSDHSVVLHTPKDTETVQAKPVASSDRCLRSRGLRRTVEVTQDSKCSASEVKEGTVMSPASSEANTPEGGATHLPDEKTKESSEDIETTPKDLSDKTSAIVVSSHAVTTRSKLKPSPSMALRQNQSSTIKDNDAVPEPLPQSATTLSGSVKQELNQNLLSGEHSESRCVVPITERMSLRSKDNADPAAMKSKPLVEDDSEKQTPAQEANGGMQEGVGHMPLRNRTVSTRKPDSPVNSPVKTSCQHSNVSATCRKTETSRTASTIEQPESKSEAASPVVSSLRKSLRRADVPVPESPPGQQNSVEEQHVGSKPQIRSVTTTLPQTRGLETCVEEAVPVTSRHRVEPVGCAAPKFVAALSEDHQQLVSSLNAKFEKVHKGWIPVDKETQPSPRPKNKADRLKEIWKSKRRIRKSRPLEQKCSPVQMLFMRPFDLSSICQWFLESTETKSLVIVKKVNTRLPSETQLCFHSSGAGAGSSAEMFPSLQAERLKKHLKKFAIASPVKSNPKNQRLISKALGQDFPFLRSKEKQEPTAATRICAKAQSVEDTPVTPCEVLSPSSVSAKNPVSARILRKYSNLREKLQVQQNRTCKQNALKAIQRIPTKSAKPKLHGTVSRSSVRVLQRVKSLKTKSLRDRPKKRIPSHGKGVSTKSSTKYVQASSKKKEGPSRATRSDVDLQSQGVDATPRPMGSEDQVTTRSQRKLEYTHLLSESPKSGTKRPSEAGGAPAKRTRTSRP